MNAVNAIDRAAADAATTAQQRAAEPSMEEILASIRRIIADDDALPLAPRPSPRLVADPPPAAAVVPPLAPVLTLVTPAEVLAPARAEPDWHVDAAAIVHAAPERVEEFYAEEPGLHFADEAAPLVSTDTSVAVHASFETLAATIMAQNAAMVEESIRGMLRPMLKSWLDDNLPVIVEKLVRTEIERVARGGR